MGFLSSFLLFLFFIAIFIVLAVIGFLRSIFRVGRRGNPFERHEDHTHKEQSAHHTNRSRQQSKKIIKQNEGEYVDFEEIE